MTQRTLGKKWQPKWVNIVFFAVTPLIAIGGTLWLHFNGGIHPATWALAAFYLYASGMSITAGYHRLFSHRSYQAAGPLKWFYIFFGSAAFQGSTIWWAAEHRVHHRYEDTDADPYGINKGFWFAHIGWLLEKKEDASFDIVKDLTSSKLLLWQRKYYILIASFTGFVFPMMLGALWGDLWGGLIVAGAARMVLNHHFTFCINSVCHYLGKQTYSKDKTARDSWFSALLTYGEGYHSFHHTFPNDYRNAVRAYEWDPTKWLIRCLSWIGMVRDLRLTRKERILAARLDADQIRLLDRVAAYSKPLEEKSRQLVDSLRTDLLSSYQRVSELKREYRRLKKQGQQVAQEALIEMKLEIKKAKQQWRTSLATWRELLRNPALLQDALAV